MQVLKEEVRQRILKSAKREFRKNGYERSSMRSIATNAKMTVGNLYRYYRCKEDLYGAIIGKLYDEINKLKSGLPDNPDTRLTFLLENFKELQKTYSAEWLSLFGGSTGTKYSKITDSIHDILSKTLKEVFLNNNQQNEDIAGPIAWAVIYGLNTILRTKSAKSTNLADSFLDFMMIEIVKRVA